MDQRFNSLFVSNWFKNPPAKREGNKKNAKKSHENRKKQRSKKRG